MVESKRPARDIRHHRPAVAYRTYRTHHGWKISDIAQRDQLVKQHRRNWHRDGCTDLIGNRLRRLADPLRAGRATSACRAHCQQRGDRPSCVRAEQSCHPGPHRSARTRVRRDPKFQLINNERIKESVAVIRGPTQRAGPRHSIVSSDRCNCHWGRSAVGRAPRRRGSPVEEESTQRVVDWSGS
jgi:hypothetical protein